MTARTCLLVIPCLLGLLEACDGDRKPAATAASAENVHGTQLRAVSSGSTPASPSPPSPEPARPPALEPAKGTPGVWENVTAKGMDLSAFGVGNIVANPARANELYIGGYGNLWKSTDYGWTWAKLDSKPNPPSLPLGRVVAVAGTTPATVWVANSNGPQFILRSTDAGLTFKATGTALPKAPDQPFYSLQVDPNDPTHLLTGVHERDGALESTDAGDTWHYVTGPGWPSNGVSWFLFFVNTGNPLTTRQTWFALAQSGGSGLITRDGGKTWTVAGGLSKLEHPHGNASLFQVNRTLFVAGIYGAAGSGVFRSTDLGESFTRVLEGNFATVWGSAKNVYAAWAWACNQCKAGPDEFKKAAMPGSSWSRLERPEGLTWGPNSIATVTDGKQTIHVGSMWSVGIWRYIEP